MGLDAPNSTTDKTLILHDPTKLPALLADLHPHYPMLLDVCGVDYPEREGRALMLSITLLIMRTNSVCV